MYDTSQLLLDVFVVLSCFFLFFSWLELLFPASHCCFFLCSLSHTSTTTNISLLFYLSHPFTHLHTCTTPSLNSLRLGRSLHSTFPCLMLPRLRPMTPWPPAAGCQTLPSRHKGGNSHVRDVDSLHPSRLFIASFLLSVFCVCCFSLLVWWLSSYLCKPQMTLRTIWPSACISVSPQSICPFAVSICFCLFFVWV